ncbi:DUF2798 domain-containing protein [Pseudaestuariivita sp.]|uniref:DUF2798 domain-containing protein n=1 Tax=Pseudaestuariivita sp. TaxID=2211669 RepID=UPI00405960EF
MRPFLPHKFENLAFGFFLSCFMTFLVSGVATLLALGLAPGVLLMWLTSWITAWAIAFPAVLVVAPGVHRLVARITLPPARD